MTKTDEKKLLKSIFPEKYTDARIRFYKDLMVLTKPTIVAEAKARKIDFKTSSTKGVIIQKILMDEYPY